MKHIVGTSCTMGELMDVLQDHVKEYKNTPGIEISVRFGTDETLRDTKKVQCRVFVSSTETDLSIYGGSHAQHYNLEEVKKNAR